MKFFQRRCMMLASSLKEREKAKISRFHKKYLKRLIFYTVMVHQISAKYIIIAEILHLLINYFVWDKMQKLA